MPWVETHLVWHKAISVANIVYILARCLCQSLEPIISVSPATTTMTSFFRSLFSSKVKARPEPTLAEYIEELKGDIASESIPGVR